MRSSPSGPVSPEDTPPSERNDPRPDDLGLRALQQSAGGNSLHHRPSDRVRGVAIVVSIVGGVVSILGRSIKTAKQTTFTFREKDRPHWSWLDMVESGLLPQKFEPKWPPIFPPYLCVLYYITLTKLL